jgi:hypothetical protein
MISFKESIRLDENLKGISKALAKLATQPAYKKVSKNLLSLSKRAAEGSKGTAKQLKTQLLAISKKLGKKEAAAMAKMSKLAGTYESVSEAVGVDMRTKGYKEAVARAAAKLSRKESKGKKTEIEEILDDANQAIFGENMVAGGSDATGDVAMTDKPLGKVKKRKK